MTQKQADLMRIDQLGRQASQGRFGLSIPQTNLPKSGREQVF